MQSSVWIDKSTGSTSSLGYSGSVELAPGRLAERLSNAAETYGGLPIDDVLKGFRQRAGLPSPGAGLSGWREKPRRQRLGSGSVAWLDFRAYLATATSPGAPLTSWTATPPRSRRARAPVWAFMAGKSSFAVWST